MASEKFNQQLMRFFDCSSGAFSTVTDRESRVDSQITVTGPELEIMNRQFSVIETGNVKDIFASGRNPEKEFRLYPTGKVVSLNLVKPKPEKNETRLYLRTDVFRPETDMIWFVFLRKSEIWIGAMSESAFSSAQQGKSYTGTKPALIDPDDLSFQDSLHYSLTDEVYQTIIQRIKRDPNIAKQALEESGYACEVTPALSTFISKSTNRPYLEVHHLVPISLQPEFELKLDTKENLAVLNPLTHRSLHHGKIEDIATHISGMAKRRMAFLEKLKLSTDDLMEMYA